MPSMVLTAQLLHKQKINTATTFTQKKIQVLECCLQLMLTNTTNDSENDMV